MIEFTVYGKPVPQGSKKAFVIKGTNRATVQDTNKGQLDPWRDAVANAALKAMNHDPLRLDGPVYVHTRFYFKRPASHYGRQNGQPYLKPTAPTFCTTYPDKDKLDRGVFDALTAAGVYTDDARVVDGGSQKFYADGPNAELSIPGAVILVRPVHTDDLPLTVDEVLEQGVLL